MDGMDGMGGGAPPGGEMGGMGGMPPGGGMGGPPMGGEMGGGGMQMNEKPRVHHGWNGRFVFWSLGPKMHNLLVYIMIGAALFMQSSATLGAPQIKQVYFSVGKLPSNAGEITVGWLGACIYDTSTKWQTCCLPSYPLDVTNFGSIDGRLKAVADIFSSNTKTRSLAFNPAAAVCTFVALIMHRVARNRGPFYFTCVACAMAYLAFFIDVSVFLPSNKDMVSKAGLESSWGLALLFMGLSAVALTPAIFVSYSRSVKAQTNWPDRDPAPKVTMGPAVGPEGGGMGAPMGGEGGMPMGGEGGMPMGGEGGMPPMGAAGAGGGEGAY